MESTSDHRKNLCNSTIDRVFFAVGLITLGICFFVPIYTDELAWKILQARYFHDMGRAISFNPECSSFRHPDAISFLPFRLWSALFYGNLIPPTKLKLLGLFSFITWIGFLIFFVRRKFGHVLSTSRQIALPASFLFFGVLPFMMSMNRPEQFMLWGISLVATIPILVSSRYLKKPIAQALIGALLLLVWMMLMSNHPKSLMFAPVFAAAGYLLIRSWPIRFIICALGLATTLNLFSYWKSHLECPQNYLLHTVTDLEVIKPKMFLEDAGFAIWQGLDNLYNTYTYFREMNFRNTYNTFNTNWLPPTDQPEGIGGVLHQAGYFVTSSVFKLILVVVFGGTLLRVRREIGERQLRAETILLAALTFSLFCIDFMQIKKAFYEAPLLVPLLILAFLLLIDPAKDLWNKPIVRLLSTFVVIASIVSQTALASRFLGVAIYTWAPAVIVVPNQPLSLPVWNYAGQKRSILEAAAKCDLKPSTQLRHLVIDDYTYPLFQQSVEPYHAYYLKYFSGRYTEPNLRKFLAEYKSDGVIARCQFLPENLKKWSVRTGPYCCLPKFDQQKNWPM